MATGRWPYGSHPCDQGRTGVRAGRIARVRRGPPGIGPSPRVCYRESPGHWPGLLCGLEPAQRIRDGMATNRGYADHMVYQQVIPGPVAIHAIAGLAHSCGLRADTSLSCSEATHNARHGNGQWAPGCAPYSVPVPADTPFLGPASAAQETGIAATSVVRHDRSPRGWARYVRARCQWEHIYFQRRCPEPDLRPRDPWLATRRLPTREQVAFLDGFTARPPASA